MTFRRSFLLPLVTALVTALVVPALTVAGAPAAPAVPTLVGISAAHHAGVDRVVFAFDGGVPADVRVRYVDRLLGDASGLPVRIAGRAVLRVRFEAADAHDASGATAPARRTFALPNVMTTVRAGDFESVLTYGIGLAKRTHVETSTLTGPSRVVLDIRAGFPTVDRRVFFLDQDRFVANQEPFFVPRTRPVRASAPAVGVMDRLFAGVLPGEHAHGLRLVRSRAKSFADLGITDGIARVRLTGGCSSGGSTVSIAGSIMPTLRQFATVDWVKIFGPGGHTADPNGPSDSIPDCLNP
jgi:hypothetical protein